jgi:hypothetical protein
LRYIDFNADGYDVVVPFTVVPEPTLGLAGGCVASTLLLRRRPASD